MRIATVLILSVGLVVGCDDNKGNGNGNGADMAASGGGDDMARSGGGPDGGGSTPQLLHLVTDPTLGAHLVDGAGVSLYLFGVDVPGSTGKAPVSNCSDACLAAWPVFHADSVAVSSELSASDFTELTRGDGAKQTAWHGWPLYYYSLDEQAGDVMGEGVDGVWFVPKQPFYNVMVRADVAATIKPFLSDGAGRSLYVFAADTRGTGGTPPVSACTMSPCSTSWPAFLQDPARIPSTLTASDFTVLTWPNGTTKQSVYRGHPLYYYGGDSAPGQTNGRGIGGVWDTLDPTAP